MEIIPCDVLPAAKSTEKSRNDPAVHNRKFRIQKCPNEQLSFSNRAICNPHDFPPDVEHIVVHAGLDQFIFTIQEDTEIPSGFIAFNVPQRKWALLSLNEEISVVPFHIDAGGNTTGFLCNVILEVDFMAKKRYFDLRRVFILFGTYPNWNFGFA